MLKPGDTAYAFDTRDCRGEPVRLADFRDRKRVVLFFFPKAFTRGCTEEVRHFRDHYEQIAALGAELIGVSVDRAETNCAFAQAEGLQFRLLGDEDRAISERYGVVWPVLKIDRRATFIIGPSGVIEAAFHHERNVESHLEDVLGYLKRATGVGTSASS